MQHDLDLKQVEYHSKYDATQGVHLKHEDDRQEDLQLPGGEPVQLGVLDLDPHRIYK